MEGGCTCRRVRYRLKSRPLIVHCCHCSWCQRESGSAFAVNAMIEADQVLLISGRPVETQIPSLSGNGQVMVRCPDCGVTVWSHYSGLGAKASFVRVGTLDTPDLLPPDIHIFTSTKQEWVQLDGRVPEVEEYYDRNEVWTQENLERLKALRTS